MGKQLIHCLGAGFLVIIVLANVSQADRMIVQNVLNKLEAYALGSSLSSLLTIEELEKAYNEYESWDLKYREELVSFTPLMHLLIDFAFIPMERFHDLIGDSEVEHAAYIKRLEKNYKRFRGSYFGKVEAGILVPSPKTKRLVDSLFELNNSKPLTIKFFQEAQNEYKAYQEKIVELSEFDDIYAVLDELESFRNYINWPSTKTLAEKIFPLLPSLEEKQFPQLKQFFIDETKKNGLMLHNGELVRFRYV